MELAITHHNVKLQDGRIIDVATEEIDLEEYQDYLGFCKEWNERNPCLKNHLRLLVAEAEWMDVNGETEEAVEKLTQGMDPDTLEALFGDDDSGPNPTLHFINAAECLTEMLLRLGRTEEASEWADQVYDMTEDYYDRTDHIPFAMALRGNCYQASGENNEAKDMYEASLDEIDDRITDLTDLRESLRRNMEELDG